MVSSIVGCVSSALAQKPDATTSARKRRALKPERDTGWQSDALRFPRNSPRIGRCPVHPRRAPAPHHSQRTASPTVPVEALGPAQAETNLTSPDATKSRLQSLVSFECATLRHYAHPVQTSARCIVDRIIGSTGCASVSPISSSVLALLILIFAFSRKGEIKVESRPVECRVSALDLRHALGDRDPHPTAAEAIPRCQFPS